MGWRFNPAEARDAHGQWTRTGLGYAAPDHARLTSKRGPYPDPGMHPFFKTHPVSAANVLASYDASTPGERAQGMRWYADARDVAAKIADGNVVKGAGVLSAYSPQTGWPVNMMNASRSFTLGRAIGPGEGMITGHMQHVAQQIMDGTPLDAALKSSKTNAFAHLIEHGGDTDDDRLGKVVIDRHALSVAVGRRLSKDEINTAPVSTDRYYQYIADAYRDATAQLAARGEHVAPHQLQAITWLHQQAANQFDDSAAGGGDRLGRGRTTAQANAWAAWGKWAAAHGVPTEAGTTSLVGDQLGWLELGGSIGAQLDLGFHPGEARDSRGRWTRFGGVGEAADVAMKGREGFSASPRTGQPPAGGFMVAQTGHTHTFPAEILDDHAKLTRAIDTMLMGEREAFSGQGTYLGGWVHDGKLWVEPSDNFASQGEAEAAGRGRNQIAIWDVAGQQEIQTGGSGGGRITEHDATGAAVRSYDEGPSLSAAWLLGPSGEGAAGGSGGPGHGASVGAQLELAGGWHDAWRHEARGRGGQWVRDRAGSADPSGWITASELPPDPFAHEDATRQAVNHFTEQAAPAVSKIYGAPELWNGNTSLFEARDDPSTYASMSWNGTMNVQDKIASTLADELAHPSEPVKDPHPFQVIEHELTHGIDADEHNYQDNAAAYQDKKTAAVEEGFTELGSDLHAADFFDAIGVGGRETQFIARDGTPNPAYDRKKAAMVSQLEQARDELTAELDGPHDRATWQQAISRLGDAITAIQSNDPWSAGSSASILHRMGTPANKHRGDVIDAQLTDLASTSEQRHATMSEYARRLAAPDRIMDGEAWGHYPWQTAAALSWVQELAKAERAADPNPDAWKTIDKRAVELADEVNRVGVAHKAHVMAEQVVRAGHVQPVSGKLTGPHGDFSHTPGIMTSNDWYDVEQVILDQFARPGAADVAQLLGNAQKAVRNAMARAREAGSR